MLALARIHTWHQPVVSTNIAKPRVRAGGERWRRRQKRNKFRRRWKRGGTTSRPAIRRRGGMRDADDARS